LARNAKATDSSLCKWARRERNAPQSQRKGAGKLIHPQGGGAKFRCRNGGADCRVKCLRADNFQAAGIWRIRRAKYFATTETRSSVQGRMQ